MEYPTSYRGSAGTRGSPTRDAATGAAFGAALGGFLDARAASAAAQAAASASEAAAFRGAVGGLARLGPYGVAAAIALGIAWYLYRRPVTFQTPGTGFDPGSEFVINSNCGSPEYYRTVGNPLACGVYVGGGTAFDFDPTTGLAGVSGFYGAQQRQHLLDTGDGFTVWHALRVNHDGTARAWHRPGALPVDPFEDERGNGIPASLDPFKPPGQQPFDFPPIPLEWLPYIDPNPFRSPTEQTSRGTGDDLEQEPTWFIPGFVEPLPDVYDPLEEWFPGLQPLGPRGPSFPPPGELDEPLNPSDPGPVRSPFVAPRPFQRPGDRPRLPPSKREDVRPLEVPAPNKDIGDKEKDTPEKEKLKFPWWTPVRVGTPGLGSEKTNDQVIKRGKISLRLGLRLEDRVKTQEFAAGGFNLRTKGPALTAHQSIAPGSRTRERKGKWMSDVAYRLWKLSFKAVLAKQAVGCAWKSLPKDLRWHLQRANFREQRGDKYAQKLLLGSGRRREARRDVHVGHFKGTNTTFELNLPGVSFRSLGQHYHDGAEHYKPMTELQKLKAIYRHTEDMDINDFMRCLLTRALGNRLTSGLQHGVNASARKAGQFGDSKYPAPFGRFTGPTFGGL